MDETREWSSFTMDIGSTTWSVDVGREVAEDALKIPNIDFATLDAWVDANTAALSAIAEAKIARGDHGSRWVTIGTTDWAAWLN